MLSIPFDAAIIEAELARRGIPLGRPLTVTSITRSTNDDAKRAAREGSPAGSAFVSDAQTDGRGRLGRRWHSPAGENLYASFLLRPAFDATSAPLVTLAAGVAVAEVIAPLVPDRRVGLKWPNDVLIDDRKVAGILSEAQLSGQQAPWVVVGIGINVHAQSFPPDIADRATSLALAGAKSIDRSSLFVELASMLFHRLEALREGPPSSIVGAFVARDVLAGRTVTVDGEPALALGVGSDGALRIRRPDGTETTCVAGEVKPA
jgi:BirA family biotin operon repressor/biotin-[acetyl-CoA-carboxylase] ligase